jgi:hypothetical protein
LCQCAFLTAAQPNLRPLRELEVLELDLMREKQMALQLEHVLRPIPSLYPVSPA